MASPMKCPLCDGTVGSERRSVPETMYRTGRSFEYGTCEGCASWIRIPTADGAESFYENEYYSFAVDPLRTFANPIAKSVAATMGRSATGGSGLVLKAALRFAPVARARSLALPLIAVCRAKPAGESLRVLDVGTGSGVLPYVLALAPRVHATGVDPFATSDASDGRFTLIRRDMADIDGEWDLIMFHHSLEHVPDPADALRRAMELLAPGGHILVRIPTLSSWAFENYGIGWFQIDAPRHEYLPTRDGLDRLFARAGLSVKDWWDDSTDVQFWMSELVVRGRPMLDPDSSFTRFTSAPVGRIALRRMRRRASTLNRRMAGDQTCVVLAER